MLCRHVAFWARRGPAPAKHHSLLQRSYHRSPKREGVQTLTALNPAVMSGGLLNFGHLGASVRDCSSGDSRISGPLVMTFSVIPRF